MAWPSNYTLTVQTIGAPHQTSTENWIQNPKTSHPSPPTDAGRVDVGAAIADAGAAGVGAAGAWRQRIA